MAWKKDLEKLKSALKAEEPEPRKAGPPPKAKPTEFKPFEEEDAVFLSAMGQPRKPSTPAPAPAAPAQAPPEKAASAQAVRAPAAPASSLPARSVPALPVPPPSEAPTSEFASAMGDLKGLVAIRPTLPGSSPRPAPSKPVPPKPASSKPVPPEPEAPVVPEPVTPPPPPEAPAPRVPVQMNLAAGMAIEVDGALDLKGHGRNDAEERLKERILDAHALGWRSLHVVLGPSEELREMLMELLQGGGLGRIARYAQAPIPMGGTQAWILYFRHGLPGQEPA